MDERDADMERFDRLLERSSLGTPGARRLRRRTSSAQVAAARRITQLRNRIVHSLDDQDIAAAATELVDFLIELGYHGQADHVLHEWLPRDGGAAADLAAMALLRSTCSAPKAGAQPHGETAAEPAGIATLTLAPASDRLAGNDPRWHDELHLLFTELHEQIGALPVRCRRWADDLPPAAPEPYVLVLLFRYSSDSVTHLSTCVRDWLDRTPGRSLDLAVNSSMWSERIVLHSGATWSPAAPATSGSSGSSGSSGKGEHTYDAP